MDRNTDPRIPHPGQGESTNHDMPVTPKICSLTGFKGDLFPSQKQLKH